MQNVELLSERVSRTRLETRRREEEGRREMVCSGRMGRVEVDKQCLDVQVEEKNKLREAEKEEQRAHDAELLRTTKVSLLLQDRQDKERRAIQKAVSNFRQERQKPQFQWEFDLNDPERLRNTRPADAAMMPPGLLGEDPGSTARTRRQKEQLREWLIQQQVEREAEKQQLQLEKQLYDQSRTDMDNKLLQLQDMETNRRRLATIATKNFNLALAKERRRQEKQAQPTDAMALSLAVGFGPNSDRKEPPESLQKIIEFQKHQIEEKQMIEEERKKEERQFDCARVDSARKALLMEMQQAKLDKQLRRQLDSTNGRLAQLQRERKPDIEKGGIDECFFSRFGNSCR